MVLLTFKCVFPGRSLSALGGKRCLEPGCDKSSRCKTHRGPWAVAVCSSSTNNGGRAGEVATRAAAAAPTAADMVAPAAAAAAATVAASGAAASPGAEPAAKESTMAI